MPTDLNPCVRLSAMLLRCHASQRGAGMQTHAITEPATLRQALEDHRPELLLDLHMPDCSGIEAACVIRHDCCYVGLPIVFLSTESALAQHQQAMHSGADDFLQKPIADHDLIQAVTARIGRFRALSASATECPN